MRLLVFLPLLIPVLAAAAARPLAARLEPRGATWLLTVAAVALAGCSTVALALLAAFPPPPPALASLGTTPRRGPSRRPSPRCDRRGGRPVLTVAAVAIAVRPPRAGALAESYRRAARLGRRYRRGRVPSTASRRTPCPAGRAGSSSPPACSRHWTSLAARRCSHTSAPTLPAGTTFTTVARLAAAANPVLCRSPRGRLHP